MIKGNVNVNKVQAWSSRDLSLVLKASQDTIFKVLIWSSACMAF